MSIDPRVATTDDANEMIRMAYSMWADYGHFDLPTSWEENFHTHFAETLNSEKYRYVVCDHPTEAGKLVAMGIGIINQWTPAYWLPEGLFGYLQWFFTEPEFRSQGIGYAILENIMKWFEEREITRVDLHASEIGQGLYRKYGFEENDPFVNLWWYKPGSA